MLIFNETVKDTGHFGIQILIGENCPDFVLFGNPVYPVPQGEHPEDGQSAGGGHQAAGCWSRIQPGETGPGCSLLR